MRVGVVPPGTPAVRRGACRVAPAVTLAALLAVALACEPDPYVGAARPGGGGGTATTFSALEAQILVPRCATAACHAGDPAPAFPSLDAGVGYGAMVGVPSQQAGLNLVEPGAPEQSYLVQKLRGTVGSAGGIATPMPIGDVALEEADIAAIEAWIASGAPND